MDDANHMVMQCPALQPQRTDVFNEINEISEGNGRFHFRIDEDIFITPMGRTCADIPHEIMLKIWTCSCRHIADMYRWKIKQGVD